MASFSSQTGFLLTINQPISDPPAQEMSVSEKNADYFNNT